MNCPCVDCEKKGCGAYHDKCENYKKYIKERIKIEKKKQEYNLNPRKKFENITTRAYYYRGISIRSKT